MYLIGHSLDCKQGFLLTNNSTQTVCSEPPQWDFLTQNTYLETIDVKDKEKQDFDKRPFFTKFKAKDDTCFIYPTLGWLYDSMKSKGKKITTKNKADYQECLSCVNGTFLNIKVKKNAKLYGKDCIKCPLKHCAQCNKLGCIYCKEGFHFMKRKCVPCTKDQVYDPFSKRCFVKKVNQY